MHRGYIKLWRKTAEWEWYKNSTTLHLFLHLLLTANHKNTRFMGVEVKRGSLVCGRKKLSENTGIPEQSIRTSITQLKSTNEITIKSTNKFSIITLCNYESYQCDKNEINQQINQQSNQQLTNNQPTTNQQLTTSKECKEGEECKEVKMGRFTPPTQKEVFDYCTERKNGIDAQRFIDYYEARGWMIGKNKMKSWQAAVRNWENKEKQLQQKTESQKLLEKYGVK